MQIKNTTIYIAFEVFYFYSTSNFLQYKIMNGNLFIYKIFFYLTIFKFINLILNIFNLNFLKNNENYVHYIRKVFTVHHDFCVEHRIISFNTVTSHINVATFAETM